MTEYADKLLTKMEAGRIRTAVRRRACQRKSYTSLYIIILNTVALCDQRDGLVIAWTDWDDAIRASSGTGGFVSNLTEFKRRKILARMEPAPAALRILHTDRKGNRRSFRAEWNASAEELRTLNQLNPTDFEHRPDYVARLKAKARVWDEAL